MVTGLFSSMVIMLACTTSGCGGAPAGNSAAGTAAATNGTGQAKANAGAAGSAAKPGGTAPAKAAAKPLPTVKPDAFSKVSDAFDALVKGMSTNDQQVVYTAETWLAMQKESAVAPLAKIVRDGDESLERRMTASRALGKVGQPAAAAIIECLTVDNERVRLRVIDAMGMVKPGDERVIDKLIELTADGDPQNRQRAIVSLARTGPAAKKAAPRLVEILNNAQESEVLRSEAKKALKEVDPRRGLMGMTK
jgi:HEAT repeat protein